MILSSQLSILLFGYQGVGKTTYASALHEVGHSKVGFIGAPYATIRLKGKNKALNTLVNEMKSNIYQPMGTKRPVSYNYCLIYKDERNICGQKLCEISIQDYHGGLFDYLQQPGHVINGKDITQFKKLGYNAILLLFNIEQFFGCVNYDVHCNTMNTAKCKKYNPYMCSEKKREKPSIRACTYINRIHVYEFIKSIKAIVSECGLPVAIAINHCADDDFADKEKMSDLIEEVRITVENYIKDIFADIDDCLTPNVYFIDSIAAINSYSLWRDGIALPLLDLLLPYLDAADLSRTAKSNIFAKLRDAVLGGGEDMRSACRNLIINKINNVKR